MLSQTNVHRLAISKLDLLTAHIRCLRIIDHGRGHIAVAQEFLNGSDIVAAFKKLRRE